MRKCRLVNLKKTKDKGPICETVYEYPAVVRLELKLGQTRRVSGNPPWRFILRDYDYLVGLNLTLTPVDLRSYLNC
jgi:hypothetical protein